MLSRPLVASLIALAIALAGTLAAADDKDGNSLDKRGGFRDAKVGMTLEEFKALDAKAEVKSARERGKVTFYTRSTDDMELFGVKIESLEYGFKDGRLAGILIKTVPDSQIGGALDMYHELPPIARVLTGYQELLGDARRTMDATRKKRVKAWASDVHAAADVKLDGYYEGKSIACFVLPVRANGIYPGEFKAFVLIAYLPKDLDLGEI